MDKVQSYNNVHMQYTLSTVFECILCVTVCFYIFTCVSVTALMHWCGLATRLQQCVCVCAGVCVRVCVSCNSSVLPWPLAVPLSGCTLTLSPFLTLLPAHSFISDMSSTTQRLDTLTGTSWPRSVFSSAHLTTHTEAQMHLTFGHWQDIRWGQRNPGDKEKQWTFAVISPLWAQVLSHTHTHTRLHVVFACQVSRNSRSCSSALKASEGLTIHSGLPELSSPFSSTKRCVVFLLNISGAQYTHKIITWNWNHR